MGAYIMKTVATGIKFDLVAGNGEVVATSEVYASRAACRKGIQSVITNAPAAKLEDQTLPQGGLTNPKFELYRDRAGDYRFRLRSRNGGIIAVSEAYSSKNACLDGVESVRQNAKTEEIFDFSQK